MSDDSYKDGCKPTICTTIGKFSAIRVSLNLRPSQHRTLRHFGIKTILICSHNNTMITGGFLVIFARLIGRKVIGSNAYVLGEVHGADVDTANWQITHLHVTLTEATRELRFRKPFLGTVIVCLPVTLIQAVGDVITHEQNRKRTRNFRRT